MQEGSRRAIIAAFFANLGLAIAKFVGFLITTSSAMLAESIHSVADTSNQGLLLLGGERAKRRPSPRHPFGYGRVRYFWAFIVALVIFSVGGLFAMFEGWEGLRHPEDAIESAGVAVAILVAGILLEGRSFWIAVVETRKAKGHRTYWQFIRRTKNPELPVVLLEDLGALLGLVIALVGIGLAVAFDQPRFDAASSLAIGVLLVAIAVVLAIELKSLLIGEAASASDLEKIEAAIPGESGERLIHMRTQHIGPDELLVAAKVHFDPSLSTSQVADAIDALEGRIRAAVKHSLVIYVEPDLYEASPTPPAGDPPNPHHGG